MLIRRLLPKYLKVFGRMMKWFPYPGERDGRPDDKCLAPTEASEVRPDDCEEFLKVKAD